MKHPPAFQSRNAAAQAAGDFDPWRTVSPARPRPGITRPLGGNFQPRLDNLQSQQYENKRPLGRTTNHNPMKTTQENAACLAELDHLADYLQKRAKRFKAEALKGPTLADKLAAYKKQAASERVLRALRKSRFQLEDAL